MATHSQVTSFLQSAVGLYLAGDMDNERYRFEHGDKAYSYVNCDFAQSTNRLNHQEFELIVDGSRFVVTVSKPHNAAQQGNAADATSKVFSEVDCATLGES